MNHANDTQIPLAVHLSNVGMLRGERAILEGLNWQVEAGEFAAVLGPNGAGKSTLTRLLMGYLWRNEARSYLERNPCERTWTDRDCSPSEDG